MIIKLFQGNLEHVDFEQHMRIAIFLLTPGFVLIFSLVI